MSEPASLGSAREDDAREPASAPIEGTVLEGDAGRERPSRLLKTISGTTLAAIGVGATAWATSFGVGSAGQPGPGFWPVVLGAVLCVSAVIFVVTNRDLKELAFGTDMGLAGVMLFAVIVYILLFEHVNFLVAAPLLIAGTQYLAGTRSIMAIVLTSVLSTAAAWILFFQILNVSPPL